MMTIFRKFWYSSRLFESKFNLVFGILSAHWSLIKTNLNCQLKLFNSQLFQRTKQLFAILFPATPAVSEEWFLTATGTNNEFLINQEFSHQISALPTARSRRKTQSARPKNAIKWHQLCRCRLAFIALWTSMGDTLY